MSVTQSCLTFCDPHMDCSPPDSSVHGIHLVRKQYEKNTVVGCHSLLQEIFQTQGSNPGLLNCKQILYFLSHQGNLTLVKCNWKKKFIRLHNTFFFFGFTKEISPGCSLEGLMLKLKLQYFGHLMRRVDSLEKTLMLGGIGGRRRRGW